MYVLEFCLDISYKISYPHIEGSTFTLQVVIKKLWGLRVHNIQELVSTLETDPRTPLSTGEPRGVNLMKLYLLTQRDNRIQINT